MRSNRGVRARSPWLGVPFVVAAWVLAPRAAVAQPVTAPPPSGLYETWSPVRMAPVGPLATPPTVLPRWLSVLTTGSQCVITFEPDRRVVWRVTYGPHGATEKRTEVDGALFSRTTFDFDAAGHLERKTVDGPGIVDGPWVSTYATDPATGRVLGRRERLVLRHSWGSRNLPRPTADSRWEVTWAANGAATTRHFIAGNLVRADTYDTDGRTLQTEFHAAPSTGVRIRPPPHDSIILRYLRNSGGTLLSVERDVFGHRAPASATTVDPAIRSEHLVAFRHSLVEQFEVTLALGAAVHASDQHRGAARTLTLDYAPGCWMNGVSGFEFDATGLLVSTYAGCICGFCVSADLEVHAPDVTGVDLHWTTGPWIRLDGAVDVTADHNVMTPGGPRAAGVLRTGDTVLTADGGTRALRAVERLATGTMRLGRNVRTAAGVFEAGGIVFESETPRACGRR